LIHTHRLVWCVFKPLVQCEQNQNTSALADENNVIRRYKPDEIAVGVWNAATVGIVPIGSGYTASLGVIARSQDG
jgi:hypothetical protein